MVLNFTFNSLVAPKYPTVIFGNRRKVCGPISNNGQPLPSKICQSLFLSWNRGKAFTFLFLVKRRSLLIWVSGHQNRIIYGMPCSNEKYEFKNIILLTATKREYLAIYKKLCWSREMFLSNVRANGWWIATGCFYNDVWRNPLDESRARDYESVIILCTPIRFIWSLLTKRPPATTLRFESDSLDVRPIDTETRCTPWNAICFRYPLVKFVIRRNAQRKSTENCK